MIIQKPICAFNSANESLILLMTFVLPIIPIWKAFFKMTDLYSEYKSQKWLISDKIY